MRVDSNSLESIMRRGLKNLGNEDGLLGFDFDSLSGLCGRR